MVNESDMLSDSLTRGNRSMASENIVLMDPKTFAEAVPHEYYAELRATAPVALREEPAVSYTHLTLPTILRV